MAALTTLAGSLAGGIAGGNAASALAGGQGAKNEVENNSLSKEQAANWVEQFRRQAASWTPAQLEQSLAKYRVESGELKQAAAHCQSAASCGQLAAQLKNNQQWLTNMADAFAGSDPQRATLYRHEATMAQQDYLVSVNRLTELATGRQPGWNTGLGSTLTVQGVAHGKPYADYERQNEASFINLLGVTTLPVGGWYLGGTKLATTMVVGGAVAGGFDAAGQYTINCTSQGNCDPAGIKWSQSLFAANTAMVATPLVGPLGVQIQKLSVGQMPSNVVAAGILGATTGYTNTSFNNAFLGDNKEAGIAAALGGSFSSLGAAGGKLVQPMLPQAPAWLPPTMESVISNMPSFIDTPENKKLAPK